MATKTTRAEFDVLVKASTEICDYGKTNIVCPRCGGKLIEIENGSAYTIRCENEGCTSAEFRGL